MGTSVDHSLSTDFDPAAFELGAMNQPVLANEALTLLGGSFEQSVLIIPQTALGLNSVLNSC